MNESFDSNNLNKKPFIGDEKTHKAILANEEWKKDTEDMLQESQEWIKEITSWIEAEKHHIEYIQDLIEDMEKGSPKDVKQIVVLKNNLEKAKKELNETELLKENQNQFISELQLSLIKTSVTEDELNLIQKKNKDLIVNRKPGQEN